MSENNDNIIDFFKRANDCNIKGNIRKNATDNFPYIKLVKDVNGNFFSEESLREYSKKVCYIVTIMKKSLPSVALYKYKVPQENLTEFLNKYNADTESELVDIEKYVPEDLA